MIMGLDRGNLPLSEAARHLIQRAEKIYVNDSTIRVNIWHILLTALTDPDHILKGIIDENRRQSLISHVRSRLRNSDGGRIVDLSIYLQACSEIAREEYIEIDDALILWQIIQKNLTVSNLFSSHGIDAHHLQQVLQEIISSRQPVEAFAPLRSFRESIPTLAIPEIWRHVTRVRLTRDFLESTPLKQIDPSMHSVTIRSLITKLTSVLTMRESGYVVILTGANGSAIDCIEYLLAYWVGQTETTVLSNPHMPDALRDHQVWKVSLSGFCHLARRRHLSLGLLLDYLKREVGQQQAILLLTDLEDIRQNGAMGRQVREQLSHPDNANIVACYSYSDHLPSEEEGRFGLNNAIPVTVEQMDDKMQLYAFINQYHRSRWAEQGCTVDDRTFDSLFALQKGIWISRKHKTWPYLGIDLVDDCIRTVKKDKQGIRKLALLARNAINNVLTKEAPRVEDAIRTEFDTTLQQIQQRIKTLCENQDLPLQDGYTVISQSLVEAQLFAGNNSEYHYPGIHP